MAILINRLIGWILAIVVILAFLVFMVSQFGEGSPILSSLLDLLKSKP